MPRQVIIHNTHHKKYEAVLETRKHSMSLVIKESDNHIVERISWLSVVEQVSTSCPSFVSSRIMQIFKECILLCYSVKLLLNCSSLDTTIIKNSTTLHRAIMSLLVLWYYIALHVSAPKAIIGRYNLTNIFKLLSCALYLVSYNLNAYYYIYLVSYSVHIFCYVS
jgi:hypothetical protein